MVQPSFVTPIAATTPGSSVKALSYVSLRSHDGKRVILPVAAAAGSRVLHGLLQGLCVMQLHHSAAPSAASVSDEAPQSGIPLSAGSARKAGEHTAMEPIAVIDDDRDEEDSTGGAAYRSYAAIFPTNAVCQPPPRSPLSVPSVVTSTASTPSVVTTSSSAASSATAASSTHLLEVPMQVLEATTLSRVAEFLVVKCTLASHPHYLHETDVFGDLDRTSERDQLTAMQVLLGADFLNC